MWVAKIKLRHDCIIWNRCRKFNIMMQSLDLNDGEKDGRVFTSSRNDIPVYWLQITSKFHKKQFQIL